MAKEAFSLLMSVAALGAFAGISVDETTGWSVIDKAGHTFGTASSTPYPGLVLHGDTTVNATTLLADCASGHTQTLSLAPDAGDAVNVTVKAQFGNASAGKRGLFYVGENGGWGAFDVQAGSLQFYELRICANAAVPDVDAAGNAPVALTLGKDGDSATVNMHFLSNESPKPVRVVFDGGAISHSDGGGGSWFYTTGGDIVLEGKPGRTIKIQSGGHDLDALGTGPNNLTVKGACDFMWDGANDQGYGGQLNIDATTSAKLRSCDCEMLYTGTTIISGSKRAVPALYIAGVDNLFPQGADKGDLEIRTVFPDFPTWINLMGTTQTVNSVVGKGFYVNATYPGIDWGVVSNRSSTAAYVVVGKYKDGVVRNVSLRGREFADNLVTVQQGNRISISNADIERYDLEVGELQVGADVAFGKLVLAEGTTLTADGITLDLSKLSIIDNGARFSAINGGSVVRRVGDTVKILASAASEGGAIVDIPEGSVLLKETAGDLYVSGGVNAFVGNLHVAAGTLGFANDCSRHEWWRLIYKKPAKDTAALPGLGGLMLSDVADRRLEKTDMAHNLTYGTISAYGYLGTRPEGVDAKYVFYPTAADMPYGSVAVNVGPDDIKWTDGGQKESNVNMLNTLFQNQNPAVQNSGENSAVAFRTLKPDPEHPETWPVITWRNKSGLTGIKGYALKQAWSGLATGPSDWSLEASPNGIDWFEVDSRSAVPYQADWWAEKGMDDYELFLNSTLCDRDASANLTKSDTFALKDMLLPTTKPAEGTEEYETMKRWIEGTSAADKNCYRYYLSSYWPGWYNGGDRRYMNPYPIRSGKDCGVFGLAAGVSVQVDGGATLKLGNALDAGRTVSRLVLDWTRGGGTIDGLIVPVGGELDLVNVPDGANLVNALQPLTLSAVTGEENFKTWTLKVNGVKTSLGLKVVNGQLRLIPSGLFILIK